MAMQSLEGWPTKAKEAPSAHEEGLAPLDTNPIFQCFWDDINLRYGVYSQTTGVCSGPPSSLDLH